MTDELERLQAENAELRADAERFRWWFSSEPKPGEFVNEYLDGVRQNWSLDQWRMAIDRARGGV